MARKSDQAEQDLKSNDEAKWPCPKGCGRHFKTKAAAGAHNYYCKYQPPVESPPSPGADAEPLELSDSEKRIVETLIPLVIEQIRDGMEQLQERVQTRLTEQVEESVTGMVRQETNNMAGKIAEQLQTGVATQGGGKDGKSPLNLISSLDQINSFLDTSLGQLIQKQLLGGGAGSKGKGSPVSMRGLSRGMGIANRMLFSKKVDLSSMAEAIMATAEAELKDRKLDPESRDMMIGMKNTAQLAITASKPEVPETPKVEGEE